MCVCVVIPFIPDVRFVDVPAGATQEESSYSISPRSFSGACLRFSRENDISRSFPSSTVKSSEEQSWFRVYILYRAQVFGVGSW